MTSASSSRVRIQREDFDLSAEVAALRDGDAAIGAVVTFVGTVRGGAVAHGDSAAPSSTLESLELEHYPQMTEAAIEAMLDEAGRRFSIRAARVVHRVGVLRPGEQIVLVAVASAHRGVAFEACEFLMDYLKTQAPFWKKETDADGSRWVDARTSDDAALERWGIASANAVPATARKVPPKPA